MSTLRQKLKSLRSRKETRSQTPRTGARAPAEQPRAPADEAGPNAEVLRPGAKLPGKPTYKVERYPISLSRKKCDELETRILDRLYEVLDPSAMGSMEEQEATERIKRAAARLLEESDHDFNNREKAQLITDIVNEMQGYGPLEPLLNDTTISDILVNGSDLVYVERNGLLELSDVRFRDNNHVMQIVDRVIRRVNRHIDESSPMCDARLPDGSRVNAVIPPLALDYPTLSIRKFLQDALGVEELVNRFGTLTDEMAAVLEACVKARLNILISGGSGSGKTTMLNTLSGFIPASERIVTIEDSAELQLQQPHVVRLETRPANIEGEGEVNQYDLLRNSLRMRPDRIILGEVRGKEALDMLQAMNTGHEGSMSTVHANSPRDAMSRLETMIAMGGLDLPQRAMRQQIASALDVILQVERYPDGTRKITAVAEVLGMEGETVTMQDIFTFLREGLDEQNMVTGHHAPTGVQPRFLKRTKTAGIEIPGAIFLPEEQGQRGPEPLVRHSEGSRDGPMERPKPSYHAKKRAGSMPSDRYGKVKNAIRRRLYDAMDAASLGEVKQSELPGHIRQAAVRLLEQSRLGLNRQEKEGLVQDVVDEMMGYGPLQPLLEDKEVSDILVNGCDQVYIERHGKLDLTDVTFTDNRHLFRVIERIVVAVGRHIDEGTPMCDARLPDGSRVNAIIPPLAVDFPSLSIRKFETDALGLDELFHRFGSLSEEMAFLLKACVKARLNILISGGTGAGKTTLLNGLSGYIPAVERLVTIEDSAELQLQQPHVVRLEMRPANIEGKGEVTPYDLLRNSLRMRPDRIILGEVRGKEALDMLQAMNTGHEGSMSTIHANSPRDAISRLETMIAMGGLDLPQRAVRQQIASAVDLIVQANRFADGSRKLTSIAEVMGMEGEMITMQDLFIFDRQGIDKEGRVLGEFIATGMQPRFLKRLKVAGIKMPGDLFLRR